jgi:hypothetical protein
MNNHLASICCALAFAIACGPSHPGRDECLALMGEYHLAMQAALVCDPAQPTSCDSGRPLTVSSQAPDGSLTLEGICMAPCLAAVNPARTAAMDEVLRRYQEVGCGLTPCWCPTPESMPPRCLPEGTCWGLRPPS